MSWHLPTPPIATSQQLQANPGGYFSVGVTAVSRRLPGLHYSVVGVLSFSFGMPLSALLVFLLRPLCLFRSSRRRLLETAQTVNRPPHLPPCRQYGRGGRFRLRPRTLAPLRKSLVLCSSCPYPAYCCVPHSAVSLVPSGFPVSTPSLLQGLLPSWAGLRLCLSPYRRLHQSQSLFWPRLQARWLLAAAAVVRSLLLRRLPWRC